MYYTQTWMNVVWVQRDVNTSVRTLTEDLNVDVQKVNFYMSMADPVSVSDDDSEFCLWVVKNSKKLHQIVCVNTRLKSRTEVLRTHISHP